MVLEFSGDRPPLPPLELIDRVSRPFDVAEADAIRQGFDSYPQDQLRALELGLAVVGRSFGDFRRLLDFGCGPGRYVRLLGSLAPTTEVHGADIDAAAIAWLRDNVPFGTFTVLPPTPPSSYEPRSFDLVINHSVFTHLDVDAQDAWLEELHRIVEPGGILLLTVHSAEEWTRTLHDIAQGGGAVAELRDRFERDGVVFIADDHYVGSAHPEGYHTAFHAPGYVLEHWGEWFDVVAYLPSGAVSQDLVVLRRPADDRERAVPAGAAATERDTEQPVPAGGPSLDQIAGAIETLASRTSSRTLALRSRLRGRRRSPDTAALRTDMEIVDVLRQLHGQLGAQAARLAAREREVDMLRVGIYEQGRRMSLLAHELRDELTAHDEQQAQHAATDRGEATPGIEPG